MSVDRGRFDLTGRVAVVTGGSRGLGRAIVCGFAEAGADVMIVSRNEGACTELAREVERSTHRRAYPYGCHVGHWDELDRLVEAAYEEFGTVDVLVNNAGSSPLYDDLVNVSEGLWDSTIGLNMKGPFRLTSLIGTRMAQERGGSIINVTSMGAVRPGAHVVPYAGAKAGLNAMTIGFAKAFGPNVRVNAIMPGAFLTDVSKHWDIGAFEARAKEKIALQRGGLADEIVGAALYFASDASSYTTGSILAVDGGGS